MPGLVRGMARTAAVVGTATATRNAVNRHSAKKDAAAYTDAINTAQAQTAPPPEQYAPPPQAYAPPPQQVAPPPEAYAQPPQQVAPPPQAYAPPPPTPPPPAQAQDPIEQLERLGALKAQGLLTEEEFNAQKTKILGM